MKTKASELKPRRNRQPKNRRPKRRRERVLAMETLQDRQLMAADFLWQGDLLRVSGTDANDFIAVQKDTLGTRIFTAESVHSEFEGRSFDSAAEISVSGGGGHDVLFNYQTDVPVSLFGDSGNDFLFSDKSTDTLEGGTGFDWVYEPQLQGVWENAFGIEGLNFNPDSLSGTPQFDQDDRIRLEVEMAGQTDIAGQTIDVSGVAAIDLSGVEIAVTGSLPTWNDAFGVTGLDLTDTSMTISASADEVDGNGYGVAIRSMLDVEGTQVDIEGSVSVTPDAVAASFTGEVENWDDAFGINGWTLADADLQVDAYTDRADDFAVHVDLTADMDVQGTPVEVNGNVDLLPDRIDAALAGAVNHWDDALGIDGLLLDDVDLNVVATSDRKDNHQLQLDLAADMQIEGRNVNVTGTVDLASEATSVALAGQVPGIWENAFGMNRLELIDTTINVDAVKTLEGSEFSIGVVAGMELLGTRLGVGGMLRFTPQGVDASLTGTIDGEWIDAFGIAALQLRDTQLTLSRDSAADQGSGFDIEIDTDLQLFGNYIDVIGNLGMGPDGIHVSFTPPGSLDFVNLLGIPGFSLEGADVDISGGSVGLEVALNATMDMGNIDVNFAGAFAIDQNDVTASLTGTVDRWDNAFDVAGLNLNDVTLTLGAESGAAGASMFIGLGAGINIGSKQLDVAGLVGFGATGWEVAFRGSVNELASTDLMVFANTITRASDPEATTIPTDALGDLELQDAYINFAPKGGNEALGITDGFGIGGEFYKDGELLAAGEFIVDLEMLSFEVELMIPELELGPVELVDVLIDIRIAAFDSHYRVAGKAELMGASIELVGMLESDGSFLLAGNGNVDIGGFAASVDFSVDQTGVQFQAIVQGSAFNAILGNVTGDLIEVAQKVQDRIDQAQAGIEVAKTHVSKLNSQLATARAEAQREVDKIKAELDSAQSLVDRARASKDYWYRVRKSRYSAWRSAVSATKKAPWYKYAHYKSIEVAKYASYVHSVSVYSAKVVTYNAANVAFNAVRTAAGWALDTAGVEANPEVIRLKTLLAAANLAVNAAEAILEDIENVNAEILKGLSIIDSLRIDQITFSGNVANYINVGMSASVDLHFAGTNHTFGFTANTGNLVEELTGGLGSLCQQITRR